jgi:S-adenosylmethionine:tRNA ribosyltransferase-isomerase
VKTGDLDYFLPEEQISQQPMSPREAAKLFVVNRKTGKRGHSHVADLEQLINENDCLVLNVTSVLRARLLGSLARTGSKREVFLIKRVLGENVDENIWEALIKGSAKQGDEIILGDDLLLRVERNNEDGTFLISFPMSEKTLQEFLLKYGHVPVPPYIHREPGATEYETVYADPSQRRSVAAPTAGFHLTEELLAKLKEKGVQIEKVVLDVGLGTFQPVRTESLEEHKIHAENIYVSEESAQRINEAKKKGKRIVAVGTTTLRVLESVANEDGTIKSFSGETNLFITPGYKFKAVDVLLTNFHLPKSSLLALVAAFIGSVEETLKIYNEAVKEKYRFFSFGDAMWIE